MKKKILIGLGLYAAAGVATALFLPSARGLSLRGKAEALAIWPGWLFVYFSGRAGTSKEANGGQAQPTARIVVPEHLRNVVKAR